MKGAKYSCTYIDIEVECNPNLEVSENHGACNYLIEKQGSEDIEGSKGR